MFGIVATEEACIDYDAANDAGQAETNDAPIEAGCAAAAALPAIHPLATIGVLALDKYRRTRLEQVLLGREEVVIRHQHRATNALRRQIDQISKLHNQPQKSLATKG